MLKRVKAIRCPACQGIVELRLSKKNLPYCCCGCGVQIFFRLERAIALLGNVSFPIMLEVEETEAPVEQTPEEKIPAEGVVIAHASVY